MAETLEGTIERITYYSEESGYTVLRLRPNKPMPGNTSRDGLATVVGSFPPLQSGEIIRFTGEWVIHAQYGKQFKAETFYQPQPPEDDLEGLIEYLGSGIIHGVRKRRARKIVMHFGPRTKEILDKTPERLQEVPGITAYQAEVIAQAWTERARQREVMVFLHGYGVGSSHALKIFKEYGEETIQRVKANPYQLARDITGIGFKTADRIAQNLGLPFNSPARVQAGVIYALETLTNEGHVFAPRELVSAKVIELLGLDADISSDAGPYTDSADSVDSADDADRADGADSADGADGVDSADIRARIDACIEALSQDAEVLVQHVPDEWSDSGGMIEALYLRPLLMSERGAARRLLAMVESQTTRLRSARTMSWLKFFQIIEREDKIDLTDQQRAAVEAALSHKVSILTGGPGTGKTTTLRTVIRALEWNKARYALASPTGRAAKRLSEATGRTAKTIHRLLGFTPTEGFTFDESEPLDVDMLIIDEASMLDLVLFYNVLKALSPDTHLMLVGDVDQLPSVGAGDVLRDLIRSNIAHVTRLNLIFRQAETSLIIANAHKINQGEMPILDNQGDDFFMFTPREAEDAEAVADLIVDVVKNRIPNRFGFNPLNDIQVLAPMYRGAVGIQVLNEKLQAALNPSGRPAEKKIGGTLFRVGDKVMQTRNNYDKEVYNGDIGRVHSIDFTDQTIRVIFDERFVDYEFSEAGEDLVHAFAVSVHKSQGSEYPAMVLAIMPQHYMMLQRNLLYTAVTRAKKLAVLVGVKRAVAMAVRNNKVARRYSALAWRLTSRQA